MITQIPLHACSLMGYFIHGTNTRISDQYRKPWKNSPEIPLMQLEKGKNKNKMALPY
jgi:hypothetical protein